MRGYEGDEEEEETDIEVFDLEYRFVLMAIRIFLRKKKDLDD